MLAMKYNIKIIYCPKYHCELNVIEDLWCNQKSYVRSVTDQSFDKMLKLIAELRIYMYFIERKNRIEIIPTFLACAQSLFARSNICRCIKAVL